VITNTVGSEITGSTVITGAILNLHAESDAGILGFTGGVGAGGVGVILSLSANVITTTTKASISAASDVDAAGTVSLLAKNTSSIDALAIGVAAGGAAIGVALAANVITNTIDASISGSAVDVTAGGLNVTAESSAIIRALAMGVSAGGFAVNVSVLGNVIVNTVTARITGSTVYAYDDVSLTARDIAPSIIPDWIVPSDDQDDLDGFLEDSPADLTNANILAVLVGVAGAGSTAVNVSLSGNSITNTIAASIDDSTVRSGVSAAGATTHAGSDVSLSALSGSRILAITAGVGASGDVAVNFTGFGNLIGVGNLTPDVEATIKGGSYVRTSGAVNLSALDESSIITVGLSIAASGGVAVSGVVGYNRIENSLSGAGRRLHGHRRDEPGADRPIRCLHLQLRRRGVRLGYRGRAASVTVNDIDNDVEASIVNTGATRSTVNTGQSVSLTAGTPPPSTRWRSALPRPASWAPGSAVQELHRQCRRDVRHVVGRHGRLECLPDLETIAVIRSFAAGLAGGGAGASRRRSP
jgi:hypothetical protein